MKRKQQIFISSTFNDLLEERQACVEAVLRAGHIPAGMELFAAGNESQLQVIYRWIDESDIYMLILGSRYGSIEPDSELSYTEVEYRYALESGKPLFALIMSDELRDLKVTKEGVKILEMDNQEKYRLFKDLVISKISRFYSNVTELKLAVLESIIDIQNRYELSGWVKYAEIPNTTEIITKINDLTDKNNELEEQLKLLESDKVNQIGNFTYEEIRDTLSGISIEIPADVLDKETEIKTNALDLFVIYKNSLSIGMQLGGINNKLNTFIIRNLVPHLRIFDLVDIIKIAGTAWSKFQTSKTGNKFLAMHILKTKK